MSEQLWERGDCYKIEASWPNSAIPWHAEYVRTKDEGIEQVIHLARLGKFMVIRLLTPQSLEVIKMWGQLDGMP